MHYAPFLLSVAATLAVANPLGLYVGRQAIREAAEVFERDQPHESKNLWQFKFFLEDTGKQCKKTPDIEISSETPNSKCLKYNDGETHIRSITFKHPSGKHKDCEYGCKSCKINVYYSPKPELADCCDRHLVPYDWGQKDPGKCIGVNPPPNHRVRYRVVCE